MSWGLQEKPLGRPQKCSWGGKGFKMGSSQGKIEGTEQSCVWYRQDGVLQPRAPGSRHAPGAG